MNWQQSFFHVSIISPPFCYKKLAFEANGPNKVLRFDKQVLSFDTLLSKANLFVLFLVAVLHNFEDLDNSRALVNENDLKYDDWGSLLLLLACWVQKYGILCK